jgi:uncharacterized protein (TIGR00369 family)
MDLDRVRESFERQGLMAHLGARIESISRGRAVVVLPWDSRITQQNGYIHAGATSSIADTAGGYAAYTLFPDDSDVLTVEYKINLIAPASGDHLEAVGTVVRSGRTLTFTTLEVFGVTAGVRTLVAMGQQTLMCVRSREKPERATL